MSLNDTLNVSTRATNTGTNALNTQLRFGIFDDNTNGGTVSASPNVGFIIEYSNVVAGGLIREQQSTVQTSPFVSPTNLGNGTQDSGADSLQGANIGPVVFNLTLTRVAGKLNLTGTISGTDSVSGNPYLQNYSAAGISSSFQPWMMLVGTAAASNGWASPMRIGGAIRNRPATGTHSDTSPET